MLGLRARLYCLGLFNILIVHGWIDETFIDDETQDMEVGPPVEDNYFLNVCRKATVSRTDESPENIIGGNGVLATLLHWRHLCSCFELDYRRESKVKAVNSEEICIVMLATPNILSYSQHAIAANKLYAEHHGYAFKVYTERLDPVRHPSWHKIKAVQQVLETVQFKYVFWIDADAIFTDFNTKLEEICFDADFCFTTDPPMWTTIANGGVWMVRNTSGAKEFFEKVWDAPERVPALSSYISHHPWEQVRVTHTIQPSLHFRLL